jgi:peroxiredoxin
MADREDRFGDLGAPGPDDERSAADKLAELDERDPEPDDPRREQPEAPRPGGRYMWVVGVAAMILITVVMVNQFTNGETGRFIDGPEVGKPLPEFAAPLVDGPEKDANVIPRSANTDDTKACEVRVPGSLNICDHWDKPVVLSFLFLRGAECEPQFDRLERVRREFGDRVNFIGVFFERDRDEVREVVGKHDWNFPLVVDRDGAITNSYAIGGCPTTVFADAGGRVRETRKGDLSEQQLRTLVGPLAR